MIKNKLSLKYLIVLIFLQVACTTQKGAIKKETAEVQAQGKDGALYLFKEGANLLFKDDEQSLEKFKKSIELDNEFLPSYFNAGLALENLNRDVEAKDFYQRCLAINKETFPCLDNLLFILHRTNDQESIENLLKSYLEEHENEPFALVFAAKRYLLKGDLVLAEKYARMAIEREAENIEALFVMQRVFYEQGKYPAAKWVGKNAIEMAPRHGNLHLWQGHIFLKQQLLVDAMEEYEKAAAYLPNQETLESLGLLQFKRGQVVKAKETFNRLIKLRPYEARNHLHLANILASQKKSEEALDSYNQALTLNNESKETYFNLGLLFYEQRPNKLKDLESVKKAKEYFEVFQKLNDDSQKAAEVSAYLKKINEKIEIEESVQNEDDFPPLPDEEEQNEQDTNESNVKEEELDFVEEPKKEELPVKEAGPKEKPKKEKELEKSEDSVFDEEEFEEDFDEEDLFDGF